MIFVFLSLGAAGYASFLISAALLYRHRPAGNLCL
jgi:hypothetical protein